MRRSAPRFRRRRKQGPSGIGSIVAEIAPANSALHIIAIGRLRTDQSDPRTTSLARTRRRAFQTRRHSSPGSVTLPERSSRSSRSAARKSTPRESPLGQTEGRPRFCNTRRSLSARRCKEAWRSSIDRASVGDAYDTARGEGFFATLECELIDRRRFRSHSEARMAVFQFIEGFYNPSRRHSALGYLSPIEYERKH